MQASTLPSVARSTPIGRVPGWDRVLLGLLAITAILATALDSEAGGDSGPAALFVCTFAAAGALVPRATRPHAGRAVRVACVGLFASSAAAAAATWSGWSQPTSAAPGAHSHVGMVAAGLLATTIVAAGLMVRSRTAAFGPASRRVFDVAADAVAASVVVGGALALMVWGRTDHGWRAVAMVSGSALAFGMTAVLSGWWPSRVAFGLLATATGLGWAATELARPGMPGPAPELVAGIAALALGASMVVEPRLPTPARGPGGPVAWRAQPFRFTWFWLPAAGLVLLPALADASDEPVARAVVVGMVAAVLALRVAAAQSAARTARIELAAALEEKEGAISSLVAAAERSAASEARLRLLFESAVDGVVEMDAARIIVRANDAFCSMMKLDPADVVGRPWGDVVEAAAMGSSLAQLPQTGEAVLISEDGTRYLEARSSAMATSPPGSVMVIRDVTASRVAEQTIRTLFQFLQDRDEDRTRLLQRTNSAIEAERNRIARDLHDGPIQGVTGATLSLEAVRLMMATGDAEGAVEMLKIIQSELGEEADNLRRVMSDLRPPVLEERGLVPAVHELCQRFERERGTRVWVADGPYMPVSEDVETLAYRVVQEALSNVAKHARATQVSVSVETGVGTLKVEVSDDGVGFDPLEARDFLRTGKVGLASMRERAELGGGTLTVRSRPGAGTTVVATLPFDILAGAPRAE